MEYPDHKTYAVLYARYFRPERLDALLNNLPFQGANVLDLCCGEGRVSFESLKRGATRIFAIDECSDMIPKALWDAVEVWKGSVTEALRLWTTGEFKPDKVKVVICQQSVNYWLSREAAEQLHAVMEPNGIFVFNTFANCPSRTPRTMSYTLEGRQYWECSYLAGSDTIHHVQVCEGILPHVTTFKWLSDEAIRAILKGLFEIRTIWMGTSVIYKCTSLQK